MDEFRAKIVPFEMAKFCEFLAEFEFEFVFEFAEFKFEFAVEFAAFSSEGKAATAPNAAPIFAEFLMNSRRDCCAILPSYFGLNLA